MVIYLYVFVYFCVSLIYYFVHFFILFLIFNLFLVKKILLALYSNVFWVGGGLNVFILRRSVISHFSLNTLCMVLLKYQ